MKSISLDNKEGIIVFSKDQKIVDCVFLCEDEECGGIRTTEICSYECPNMCCCELLAAMNNIVERASYKESDV